MNKVLFCISQWQKKGVKLADLMVAVLLISCLVFASHKMGAAQQTKIILQPLKIEIVVPNLDPLVASQIQVSDLILDQKGKPCFEIIEMTERPAEHPTIDAQGNIVVTPHPRMMSLFLTIRALDTYPFSNGIPYNWQVIKTGGSIIWETQYCRFVGLVRKIS